MQSCCSRRRSLAAAVAMAIAGTAQAGVTYTAASESELIQAISDANGSPGADTIDISADITLTAALPTITEALTITGSSGQRAIRRDDSGDNACSPTAANAFRLIDASADLTLQDLTLTGGCNLVDQGGAVRVQNAALSVVNSVVSGNNTFVDNGDALYGIGIGGGVAVLYGSATLTGSTISNNATHGYLGCGGGIAVFQGDLSLMHSTISGNATNGTGPFGGGVYVLGGIDAAGAVTITDSIFSGNTATGYYANGGGFWAYGASVSIVNSRITGNSADGTSGAYAFAYGGGVYVNKPGLLTVDTRIERTLISGNSVTGNIAAGGGVDVLGATLEMTGSAVIGNTVHGDTKARAGGIKVDVAQAQLISSTVSGNSIDCAADEGGGAIQVYNGGDATASLTTYNTTIASNSSPHSNAGGVFFKRGPNAAQPTAVFESSILAGNLGADGDAEIGSATETGTAPAITIGHSLIQGSIDPGAGELTLDGVTLALFGADPLLQPLAYNGGPTPTHSLAPNSPAIDHGTNTQNLDNDQRGAPYARVVGAAADIGAYELDPDRIFAGGFD